MKKFLTSRIFTFVLGAVIFGSIGVVSAYTIFATDIGYTPKDTTWKKSNGEDITNVKDAIDELYSKANSLSSLSNKICTYQSEGSYGQKVEIGARYDCEVGASINKNFYILAVRDKEVDLIMDKNINNGTMSWNDAMKYFRTGQDGANIKSGWTNVLEIDLPKAQDIADAINYNIIVTDNYIDSRHSISSDYAWLINHTTGCTSFGCTDDSDATSEGYWTRDLFYDEKWAYDVISGNFYNTNTNNGNQLGIRPVITVLKSQLN